MKRLQLYMSTHKQFEHTQHQHPLLPGMDPASGGQSIKEKKKKKLLIGIYIVLKKL